MLDPTRSRATVSRRLQTAVTIVTFAALVPVAGMRLEASAAVVPHPNTPIASPALASVSPVIVRPRIAAATIAPVSNVAAPQRRDSTFEQSLPAEPGQRLILDLDSGGEVILHGWDEPRARLRARLSGRTWRDTRVEFTRVDNGIELRSDFVSPSAETETSHTFELWVPRRSDVKLSSAGGALSIEDLDGRFTGHTGGGAIEIRNARGSSSLTTGGGDINVSRSDLSGTVSTGGGAVMLSQVTGGLRGSSGSGPVIYGEGRSRGGRDRDESRRSDTTADLRTVTISGNRVYTVGSDDRGGASARGGATITNRRSERSSELGPLHISKAGGSITLDDAPEGGTLHTGGGDITIERAGGDLTATTGGGDIELRRVAGSASVITGAGDVHITVVDDEGREHTIEASSGSGTIEVVLPASIDARVELESAYTESFGRRTRVESDWRLERSESADWETVYGTPRKFVRARGTLGSGRGLIRIKTVNGDVIVRRAER